MPMVQVLFVQQNNCMFHQGNPEELFKYESLATLNRSHLSIQASQVVSSVPHVLPHKDFVEPKGFSHSQVCCTL